MFNKVLLLKFHFYFIFYIKFILTDIYLCLFRWFCLGNQKWSDRKKLCVDGLIWEHKEFMESWFVRGSMAEWKEHLNSRFKLSSQLCWCLWDLNGSMCLSKSTYCLALEDTRELMWLLLESAKCFIMFITWGSLLQFKFQ